jgi:adenylylsulfate kinase-like enzyme
VNGFPSTIADVLRYGKQINVLLFDGDDIRWALRDDMSFTQVLEVKLRRAAQHGDGYYRSTLKCSRGRI